MVEPYGVAGVAGTTKRGSNGEVELYVQSHPPLFECLLAHAASETEELVPQLQGFLAEDSKGQDGVVCIKGEPATILKLVGAAVDAVSKG